MSFIKAGSMQQYELNQSNDVLWCAVMTSKSWVCQWAQKTKLYYVRIQPKLVTLVDPYFCTELNYIITPSLCLDTTYIDLHTGTNHMTYQSLIRLPMAYLLQGGQASNILHEESIQTSLLSIQIDKYEIVLLPGLGNSIKNKE